MRIKYFIIYSLTMWVFLFGIPTPTLAHCPLCAAGAGVGLTLSRLLGVDDSITGIWLGAFLGSISFWTYASIPRRFRFFGLKEILLFSIATTTLWSFYVFKLIDTHAGQIAGIDKLTLGIGVGSFLFYVTDYLNGLVISRHKGFYFPYQRVAVSLFTILIVSIGMYILINFYI